MYLQKEKKEVEIYFTKNEVEIYLPKKSSNKFTPPL